MEYVVYCDESRHEHIPGNSHMAIGGLWVPRAKRDVLSRQFTSLKKSLNLNAEVKWRKVSRSHLDAYKQIVDFFFEQEDLAFRVIVVEQSKVDIKLHGGDRELGFYKFYYEMLVKWMLPGNQYVVLLDFKKNKGADRTTTLKRFLQSAVVGRAWIKDLTVIDSERTPLVQITDVLTGAVAASWSGLTENSPKHELASYVAKKCNSPILKFESNTPEFNKFNVFRVNL